MNREESRVIPVLMDEIERLREIVLAADRLYYDIMYDQAPEAKEAYMKVRNKIATPDMPF